MAPMSDEKTSAEAAVTPSAADAQTVLRMLPGTKFTAERWSFGDRLTFERIETTAAGAVLRSGGTHFGATVVDPATIRDIVSPQGSDDGPELHEHRITRSVTASWLALGTAQPFTAQADAYAAGWAARDRAEQHPDGVDRTVVHITLDTRNLGYYRTQVDCSCGTPWWFGGHDGDPSHDDAKASHLAGATPFTERAHLEPAPADTWTEEMVESLPAGATLLAAHGGDIPDRETRLFGRTGTRTLTEIATGATYGIDDIDPATISDVRRPAAVLPAQPAPPKPIAAHDYPCTNCGAAPGEYCLLGDVRVYGVVHTARSAAEENAQLRAVTSTTSGDTETA